MKPIASADVLVIDDQVGPRDSLRMILKDCHQVRTAASGPEGLELIGEQKPDLVFVDIKMPGMDGVEVMRRIKALDPDIEVAIITAYAGVESAQEAVRCGALDYLTKPFGVEEVRAVVDRAIERQQKRIEDDAMLAQLRQITGTLARRLGELSKQPGDSDQSTLYRQLASAHTSIEDQLSNVGRLSAIGEIAAEVAHDINNFLSAMLLRIEVLLMKTRDSAQISAAEVAGALHEMEGVVRDSVHTVERIASFSRSDPFEPNERVRVNDILKSAADFSLGRAQRHRAQQITWELQDLPEIIGNTTALRTVFVNLFINAWQAMEEDGGIRVRSHSDGSQLVVELHDTGSGMSPEALERSTEPFFTTKHEGTGLGLSIARKVIDRHGGSMVFDSVLGQGTTVTVYLPVDRAGSEAGDSSLAPDVMVVDDEEGLVNSLRSLFEAHGLAVSSATSGVGALAQFESCLKQHNQAPRVVVVDLRMSGLSGTDIAKRMKQLAPDTRIVLLSAYLKEEPEAGTSPDIDVLMTKPFDPDELLRHVADVTGVAAGSASQS